MSSTIMAVIIALVIALGAVAVLQGALWLLMKWLFKTVPPFVRNVMIISTVGTTALIIGAVPVGATRIHHETATFSSSNSN